MPKNAVFPRSLLLALAAVVVALLCYALWHQRSEMERVRKENEWLMEQNRAAREEARSLRMARPIPPEPAGESRPDPAGSPAQSLPSSTQETPPLVESTPAPGALTPEDRLTAQDPSPGLVMTPTGFAPPPQSTGLSLGGTHVAPVAGGLQATMRFFPNQEEPLGIVAVVVRLPRNSESRILGLDAAGSMEFTAIAKRVSEDGKFAVFQGTAQTGGPVEFALSVSGTTVADVRGTTGIGVFALDIGPVGATVTPK